MSLLLPEDEAMKLPRMYRVRQKFARPVLTDIAGEIRKEFGKPEIAGKVKPGMRVAVGVGSRGIRNLPLIVKTTLEELEKLGAKPFIVSAMGSHGGGTEEGQRAVLESYGITEAAMGVPVVTKTEVVKLGETASGIEVFFDRTALEADLIVPINRVKLHTDFVSDIQSGLCKMLVIGLGNRKGCSAMHEAEFSCFGETIKEAARMILGQAPVGFGVAVLENAYDETSQVELVPAESLIEREVELVRQAKKNMPLLMIPKIDVLVVEAIGKDISGAGFDPNILGRSSILKEFVLEVPEIGKMVLLDVSEASHGNGIGLGLFDVVTEKVVRQLDFQAMYANAIAVKALEDCKIPLVARDEAEAVKVAVKCLRGCEKEKLRIVKIRSTLELEEILVSEALAEVVEREPRLELLGPEVE
ncbi:MAG: lactate racemase domain-containing protein [Eubacteriales bacterium]|nr:lactate racemase domain-containing protein [Eubacteriales bacterium]